MEVETIKRQAETVCSCSAVRLARVCGLSLQPIGCTFALACEKQCNGSCSCRYISVIPLPYLYFTAAAAALFLSQTELSYSLLGCWLSLRPQTNIRPTSHMQPWSAV